MRFLARIGVRRAICAVISASLLLEPIAASAALLNLVKAPLFVTPPIPPLVMLDISKDQQLFKKAYNDYSDLDNDGKLETTYKHSIDYYGYFDSYKCYDYVVGNGLESLSHYAPTSYTSTKYCDGTKWSGNFLNWATMTRMDTVRKLLYGGMRRRDNATSPSGTNANTLLERANLPSDAHSFAKWYGGTDVNQLTPFPVRTTPVNTDTTHAAGFTVAPAIDLAATGTITFNGVPQWFIDTLGYGDQVVATSATFGTTKTGRLVDKNNTGRVVLQVDGGGNFVSIDYSTTPPTPTLSPAAVTPPSGTTDTSWKMLNLSSTGISICNYTQGDTSGSNRYSHSNSYTPRMKIAAGNFELWGANERFQCYWYEQKNNLQGGFGINRSSNGNQAALSGLNASAENPNKDATSINGSPVPAKGLGYGVDYGEYRVMVEACHKSFTPTPAGQKTTEKCKQYDQTGEYKPIGLLQVYGDDGRISFGLMTGSYSKNTSGGVLRKNVGSMSDEINSSGVFSNPSSGSIIGTLSRLRIYGYDYNDGTYIGADGNCTYQLTSDQLVDNMCRSWGNPMSEIYAESLRYFAGATAPTTAFQTSDTSLFSGLNTATWPNPNKVITKDNYCTPLNVLLFNASVSSKDHDQVPDPFNGAISGFSAKTATDKVGSLEGLDGKSFFVGNNGVTSNALCDAKPFGGAGGSLGGVQGLCPEAPSLNGTYLMSGMAFAARTNRIRTDLDSSIPATDKKSLKVSTYGISLATNVPRIEIPVPGGSSGQKVVIQPTYRLTNANGVVGRIGSGAIVDVKIVSQTTTPTSVTGRMYVNWEDSEQGGDYDQDVWGVIDYTVTATQTRVTTNVVAASTANPQGFGYTISGTTQDGPHFHSGIYNFNYNDPTNITVTPNTRVNATGGCNNCNAPDSATTAVYTNSSTGAAQSLNDPLWYAAKYGGFVDSNGNNEPDVAVEYDNFNNATGALGSDGIPDNFFLVSNPLGLEAALDKLFVSILQAAAASAVAANSSRLNTSTRIYQAVFNPSDWSGKMNAFGVNASTGTPNTTADWDGGQIDLNSATVSPSNRVILTYNKGVASGAPQGIAFRWPTDPTSPLSTELTTAQVAALRLNPDTATGDPVPSPYSAAADPGNKRLEYLRGDGTNEGISSTNFRRRTTTKLGDIVNSNPNFVGAPDAGHPDASYLSFASANRNRKPVLYVGANDGMLHGFNACPPGTETRPTQCGVGKTQPGAELLGYIPSAVYRNLSKLTSRAYSHEYFVDGSPAVEDALVGSNWKTVLVGGLNRGGQGIYALDVTNPENFSETNAASLVLWEFTDADDPDLGFTFGTPVIRKMRNGKWAAILSGGYNNSQGPSADPAEIACASGTGTVADPYLPAGCTVSRTGQAYIFILFLDGPTGTGGKWVQGTDYIKLSTGTGSVATPNGVGSPFAGDTNGDSMVDLIYAGDLEGALWKFDVSATTTTTWTASGSRLKLFNAVDDSGNAQPITAGVEAALHPTGNGIIVSFGTGKYLESDDINPPGPAYKTQTIYGIWDKLDGTSVSGRSVLMPQLLQPGITNIVTNPDGSISRITTRHQPNYGTSNRTTPDNTLWDGAPALADKIAAVSNVQNTLANQRGWYLDLFNGQASGVPTGERIIFTPFVRSGVVFYGSLWPVGNTCLGSTAGDNITLMIGTGARPDASVFDLDANALVNAADLVNVGTTANPINVAVSSRRVAGGSAQPPTLVAKGTQFVGFQNPTGGQLEKLDLKLPGQPGRVSWREILY